MTPRQNDDYAGLVGRFYSFYIAHPALARRVGRLIWGSDFTPLYRSLGSLGQLDASVVLDAACGAGLALRWLDPVRVGRYVGVDNSPAMLARARRVAGREGFPDAELRLADVTAIPLPDRSADVVLLYNGLHCFPDPEVAVAEAVRCLKPGGRLVGSMLVRGGHARTDRLMAREAAKGRSTMRKGGTAHDLERWLAGARLTAIRTETAGSLAVFTAELAASEREPAA